MAAENPSYYQSDAFNQEIKLKEHLFHFYMFQRTEFVENPNQRVTVVPKPEDRHFGITAVNDWEIRDGPSMDAKIVARAQGVHHMANMTYEDWHLSFNILFTEDRFKTSSLKVLGNWGHSKEGEWAIIGGSGEFAFAQGTVEYKETDMGTNGNYKELQIRAYCLNIPKRVPISKVGPWGGKGGNEFDIPTEPLPQRLESVTIGSRDAIISIAFTYAGPDGKTQTVGPWGGKGGMTSTLKFAPSEILKGVSGTTGTFAGEDVVTSLTFVTNVRTYGPFGKTNGTNFNVPIQQNSNIIGFFARAGTVVNAIGVYTRPSLFKSTAQ